MNSFSLLPLMFMFNDFHREWHVITFDDGTYVARKSRSVLSDLDFSGLDLSRISHVKIGCNVTRVMANSFSGMKNLKSVSLENCPTFKQFDKDLFKATYLPNNDGVAVFSKA